MPRSSVCRPLALALLGLAATAHAQVAAFELDKTLDYVQTGDSAVSAPSASYVASLYTSNPGEATAFSFSANGYSASGGVAASPETLRISGGFASPSALEAALGPGGIAFSVNAGSLAGGNGLFEEPASAYPNAVPSLTGNSFSRLQGMDATRPITLVLSSYSNPAPISAVYLVVFNPATDSAAYYGVGEAGTRTSFTLDAGTLVPGTDYQFQVLFRNVSSDATATFDGDDITGFAEFHASTTGVFRTSPVPEPTSLAALGLGVVALIRRRGRRL